MIQAMLALWLAVANPSPIPYHSPAGWRYFPSMGLAMKYYTQHSSTVDEAAMREWLQPTVHNGVVRTARRMMP